MHTYIYIYIHTYIYIYMIQYCVWIVACTNARTIDTYSCIDTKIVLRETTQTYTDTQFFIYK